MSSRRRRQAAARPRPRRGRARFSPAGSDRPPPPFARPARAGDPATAARESRSARPRNGTACAMTPRRRRRCHLHRHLRPRIEAFFLDLSFFTSSIGPLYWILTSSATFSQVIKEMAGALVSLQAFQEMMGPMLIYEAPRGHIGPDPPKVGRLSDQSQRFFFRLIRLVLSQFPWRCFAWLRIQDILVDPITEQPYFSPEVHVADVLIPSLCDSNINDLAEMIEAMIKSQGPAPHLPAGEVKIPREVRYWLDLMMGDKPLDFAFPIQYNPALVPLENRGWMYIAVYDCWNEAVRNRDYLGFEYILGGIDPAGDWAKNVISSNVHLAEFYHRGWSYDETKAECAPVLYPLDFSRNVHAHPYKGAARRQGIHGRLRFTTRDMNLALYLQFPTQLAGLCLGLYVLGYLCHLHLERLFPY